MHEQMALIHAGGALPDNAQYIFDELQAFEDEVLVPTTVQKTRRRQVVTLKYGTFQAREVVRDKKTADGQKEVARSSQLAQIVAPGCRYGFDVVALVGWESFVLGRRIREMQYDLQERSPAIDLPASSLDALRRRFLFYLGQVHRRAAPALRDVVHQAQDATWLIDGTLEPGTAVFFGIQDARTGILLGCWKIPTENADDIAPCLQQAAREYGPPQRVLHDLNSAMSLACERALEKTPHGVCHFHFARDVGEDLLTVPQNALSSRLRRLKLQVRMREQRKSQTEWLRQNPQAALILQQLLRGEPCAGGWTETLSKEVLLAFHFWMLDFAADGGRQGFPFDPYFLYFHRRLICGCDALNRLLSSSNVTAHAPQTLWNLRDQLQGYRTDPQIIAASDHYELAFREFDRLRTALRLQAAGNSPMREGYLLSVCDWQQVRDDLNALTQEYRQRIDESSNQLECQVLNTILVHLDNYSSQLAPPHGCQDPVRTTNRLERHWSQSKRTSRQTQGRRKLTRTFQALPPELMLIPNLRNPDYVSAVLGGDPDQLAAKFAETAQQPVSYASWRKTNTSLNLGRIPNRILRQSNFVEQVIEIYDTQCRDKNTQAA
jgi:hypothetical protein